MAGKNLRIGVVGFGNIGGTHVSYLAKGEVPGAVLAGVADSDPAKLRKLKEEYGEKIECFDSAEGMIASGKIDAVIIAVPHYDHPKLCIFAMEHGVHPMSEKPAGVYTKQVKELNAASLKHKDIVFGVMFNQRTIPAHQKVREIIASGELGEIRRVNYTITNWLRSQRYYDSGGWRGTWGGEGGGVLMNQCPHNLDLFTWWCGVPQSVRAFIQFGRFHKIEVEDDVTAYLKFENGATGVFVTTTGEAPGVNRFELAGDRGLLTLEDEKITFRRTRVGVQELIDTTESSFPSVEVWDCKVPAGSRHDQHRTVTENFVSAIVNKKPLLAPGTDGIKGLSLCNAMLLSAWTDRTVEIPFDDEEYLAELQKRIKGSTFVKPEVKADTAVNMAATYGGAR